MELMELLTLGDPSGSTAKIAAHRGMNCVEFLAALPDGASVDVIASEPGFETGVGKPSWNGIPILFPYPNRIRDGRFSWNGRDYELPESKVSHDGNGHAIHGFCLDRTWRVTEHIGHQVVGEFQLSVDAPECLDLWPADFVLTVRYTLHGPRLRLDVTVRNPDTRPLPWGFGTHAYFRLPLSPDSDSKHCLIEAPAHEQWELVDCLPAGRKTAVTDDTDLRDGMYYDVLKLDDVLTGLKSENDMIETTIYDESAGLQVIQRFDTSFRDLVVFNPPWADAVCMEPYTCVTDAINLEQQGIDAGLRVLEPGQECSAWIEIAVGRIIC